MTVGANTRITAGAALLALAVVTGSLAHGVGQAGDGVGTLQAAWQRGTVPDAPAPVGRLQASGERLLGIAARNDVLRAYARYRAGLAEVIPGTLYPQTQARWDAIAALSRLRENVDDPPDRASVDLVLGRIQAAAAAAAGPTTQRKTLRDNAITSFRHAVREDPSNADAKHDLEVLLAQAGAVETRTQRSGRAPAANGKPASSPRSQVEGSGY
jgi:hypothetical protein